MLDVKGQLEILMELRNLTKEDDDKLKLKGKILICNCFLLSKYPRCSRRKLNERKMCKDMSNPRNIHLRQFWKKKSKEHVQANQKPWQVFYLPISYPLKLIRNLIAEEPLITGHINRFSTGARYSISLSSFHQKKKKECLIAGFPELDYD